MLEPPRPPDEDRRLRALRSISILDTHGEERFDRITRLARRLFGVPIALVSLVDRDRQWFKSRAGLDATETSRSISFCGHAILRDATMVVENALEDERFADNPLVTGPPDIRFYAGRPVKAPGGERLGTLCIIDREPREFTPEDEQALRDLGAMVEAELASLAQATTDALTHISNRRGFELLGEHALRAAARNGHGVALAFFDLDRFKELNDSLGHAAGDQALIEMAALLLEVFRDSDVVARFGGDEFAVLLTDIEAVDVHRPLERFAKCVAERNAAPTSGFGLQYSAGVATHPMDPPVSMKELLAEADHRMYEAKRKARPE